MVLASHTSTDEPLAVKILIKNREDYEEVLKESRILKEVCTSPFCVRAYGTFQTKVSDYLIFILWKRLLLNGYPLRIQLWHLPFSQSTQSCIVIKIANHFYNLDLSFLCTGSLILRHGIPEWWRPGELLKEKGTINYWDDKVRQWGTKIIGMGV